MAACGRPDSDGSTENVTTWLVSKPGPRFSRLARLRPNRPAPPTSSVERPTWATTSDLRKRACCTPPPAPAVSSRSARLRSRVEPRTAGASPKSSAVRVAVTKVKATTRRSGAVESTAAWLSSGSTLSSSSPSHTDSTSPSRPPPAATTALSTSVCRIRRARPAPSARRTLISRCRPVARASIRLATLAQAMSNTSPTMPMSISAGALRVPRSGDNPREASWSVSVLAANRSLKAALPCA